MENNRPKRSSAFDYVPPSYSEATKYSERRNSQYDALIIADGPRFFKARQNNNTIRILPPSWDGARHYSLEVKVHNDVGVSKQQYLCLLNEGSPEKHCPLCEERNQTGLSQEDREKLRAKPRNFIYLIDRFSTDPEPMPLLWSISTTSDKEILAQSLIKRSQEYLPIAHPTKGYDVDFRREGDGLATRYRGFMVSRDSTPISSDPAQMRRWIDYIDNHPIPEVMQYFPADYIQGVYEGGVETGRSRGRDADRERDPRDDGGRRGNGGDDRQDDRFAPRTRPPVDDRDVRAAGPDDGGDPDAPPFDVGPGNDDRRGELRRRLDHDRR